MHVQAGIESSGPEPQSVPDASSQDESSRRVSEWLTTHPQPACAPSMARPLSIDGRDAGVNHSRYLGDPS
ncbi:MAG: hypothetical protein QF536_10545, partial [Arenicellales bacterium]|nr:hypothetical protein [Arenicellales bacterium]